MRYEVIFLKNVLRYLFDSNEDRVDIDLSAYQAVFERHSEMDPNVLMQAESVEGLIGLLQETIYGKTLEMVGGQGKRIFLIMKAAWICFFSNSSGWMPGSI